MHLRQQYRYYSSGRINLPETLTAMSITGTAAENPWKPECKSVTPVVRVILQGQGIEDP